MIKNNKKAFTLIELLAVIVILAIIALIATPIILGIVEDARKDAFFRSVEILVSATDMDIVTKPYENKYTYEITDGNIPNLEVGVKNTDGMNGKIKYDKNGNDTYAIHNGKYCVIKTKGMKSAEIIDYVEGECELGKTTDLKYFTYEEIEEYEYEYEIVDKNACKEYLIEEWDFSEDEAISMCDNEPDPWDGMTLIEQLTSGVAPKEVGDGLKEVGAIEEKVTLLFEGIEITGYSEEGPKDVVIPEEINGKEVVSIGAFAFSNKSLTSVELPETLVKIGHSAFSTNLFTDMTLPSDLEIIEDYAFCYTNLNQSSVNDISEINEYAYCTITDENCFTYEDAKLVEYEIVDIDACVDWFENDGYDEEDAISYCNNEPNPWDGMTLTEYLITDPEWAFVLKEAGAIEENITSLEGIEITGYKCAATDVVIPEKIDNQKVVVIGNEVFNPYSGGLGYFNNGNATPVNYDLADEENFIHLTRIAMPDTVTYIGSEAFANNEIYSLKLSSNLLSIGPSAFKWNNLNQLTIPDTIITIGGYAFGCMSISENSKGYQKIYNINPDALLNDKNCK